MKSSQTLFSPSVLLDLLKKLSTTFAECFLREARKNFCWIAKVDKNCFPSIENILLKISMQTLKLPFRQPHQVFVNKRPKNFSINVRRRYKRNKTCSKKRFSKCFPWTCRILFDYLVQNDSPQGKFFPFLAKLIINKFLKKSFLTKCSCPHKGCNLKKPGVIFPSKVWQFFAQDSRRQ